VRSYNIVYYIRIRIEFVMTPRTNRNRNLSFVDSPNATVVLAEKKKRCVEKSAVACLKCSEKTLKDLLKKASEAQLDVDLKKVRVKDASLHTGIVANMRDNLVQADKRSIEFVVHKLILDERLRSIGVEVVAACAYGHRGGLTQTEIADKIRHKGPDLAFVIQRLINGDATGGAITQNDETQRYLAINVIRKHLGLRPAPEADDSDDSDDSEDC
jgi:hypothetical protein